MILKIVYPMLDCFCCSGKVAACPRGAKYCEQKDKFGLSTITVLLVPKISHLVAFVLSPHLNSGNASLRIILLL